MLCEQCKEKPASVHVSQNINGEKKQMHLCADCAENMNFELSFNHFFAGFLDNFLDSSFASYQSNLGQNAFSTQAKCPRCGMTYEVFKKTGKLGCSDCYETFRNELAAVFKNIQGDSTHNGKLPRKIGSALMLERRIDSLKQALQKAVQNEEYEEAARLRDEIRSIKGGFINEQ